MLKSFTWPIKNYYEHYEFVSIKLDGFNKTTLSHGRKRVNNYIYPILSL